VIYKTVAPARKKQREPVILITGGAGFLGHALVRELLKQGKNFINPREIRIFDARRAGFKNERIVPITGDVRSLPALRKACNGVDIVFHCAAVVDWGQHPEDHVYDVNVTGTNNVIRASTEGGARALVYTSTMDVIYDGKPVRNADETMPYPKNIRMAYARTKALAEQAVLDADGAGTEERRRTAARPMRTCSLRPCGMFGERDPYHVGTILRMARESKLLFRFGDGKALFQHVYVGNTAHAHVLAAKALIEPGSRAAGKVYFITDYPAKNFFDAMEPIISGIGYRMPPRDRSIPAPFMAGLAAAVEAFAWLCRPVYRFTPRINRISVGMVCRDFTFSGEKAVRELGYRPLYSEEEAIALTIAYFKETTMFERMK